MSADTFSDLHFEFGSDWLPPRDITGDVMILAGDIITLKSYSMLERFLKGWDNAAKVLRADISFNEPVGAIQIVRLGENGAAISAYSLKDVIAEKYRAFMQQEKRRTKRRQDIYDLSLLLEKFSFDDEEKQEILDLLIEKSRVRDIHPDRDSLQNDANIERAKSEWATLEQEIGELPDFDRCFAIASDFYCSLPWQKQASGKGK